MKKKGGWKRSVAPSDRGWRSCKSAMGMPFASIHLSNPLLEKYQGGARDRANLFDAGDDAHSRRCSERRRAWRSVSRFRPHR
ncbi:MAG TPA: hypothetical protein PLF76_01865, partial [Methanomassiliicoccaceae archaeon]|nr:hypothetical protein [Methanomassiliicoccaceae archaeon]